MSDVADNFFKLQMLKKEIADREAPDSHGSSYSLQHGKENGEIPRAIEDMEGYRGQTDGDKSEPIKITGEDEGEKAEPSFGCNGSFRGVDFTVKQIPIIYPVEAVSPSPSGKKRRRAKVAKTYYCAHCEFNSPRWDRLKEHLIVHLEDRPFACEHCDFKTKTAKKLKRHQTVHSQERKYECSMCNFTFKRAHTLKEHILTHSKEKLFFCSVCDYSTHRSQYLKRHMMKHTNEYLQCHLCSFKTVYATLLRRHLQIHTAQKLYKCQFCDYSSVYLQCVNQHKRTHENHILYECGICDFTTTHHSSLRTHMYIHSKGDRKFQCNFCPYASIRRCDVKRHQQKIHKDLMGLEEPSIECQNSCLGAEQEGCSKYEDVNSKHVKIEMEDDDNMTSDIQSQNGNTNDTIPSKEKRGNVIYKMGERSDFANFKAVYSENVSIKQET